MAPAPAVQALCYIPRIHHSEWVDFMIDTGASATCLNGIYALGLEQFKRVTTIRRSTGISGSCDYFYEDALLIFMDMKNRKLAILVTMIMTMLCSFYKRICAIALTRLSAITIINGLMLRPKDSLDY